MPEDPEIFLLLLFVYTCSYSICIGPHHLGICLVSPSADIILKLKQSSAQCLDASLIQLVPGRIQGRFYFYLTHTKPLIQIETKPDSGLVEK